MLCLFFLCFQIDCKVFFKCYKHSSQVTPSFFKFSYLFYFFEFYFIFIQQVLISYLFYTISVYMSIPISQFITPPPPPRHFPPLEAIRLFSPSVSIFLPCKPVHLYHFSRFHIYAVIYNICFSLSDLLHSV